MQPQEGSRVTDDQLKILHPRVIESNEAIHELLVRARSESATFRQGMNSSVLPEEARLTRVGRATLEFECRNFEEAEQSQDVLLRFELKNEAYFFRAKGKAAGGLLCVDWPSAIYAMERRDRPRRAADVVTQNRWRARIFSSEGCVEALVRDLGPGGVGVEVSSHATLSPPLTVKMIDGPARGFESPATIRHVGRTSSATKRLGLAFSAREQGGLTSLKRTTIAPGTLLGRSASTVRFAGWAARATSRRLLGNWAPSGRSAAISPVKFRNMRGEELVGLVDSWGDTERATAVIVPPAWGRTKETLLPLARTIVATFRAARQPVLVLRFDGIRRRGESYIDPECRGAGREYQRFTFSQGVDDILTAAAFIEKEYAPQTQVLVTFSAASIDGRKAVALDGGARLGGWICVVGSADLQSLIRVISGGVDYVGGLDRGLRFGLQQILGVEVDIDRAGLDAIENGLAYLEDSRRDFEQIRVPVVWYHGRHDAWMNASRAAEALSHGKTANRVMVEVPTGHQLRSSVEALQVFQAVACEIAAIAPGRRLSPRVPSFSSLERQQRAERARRGKREIDLGEFWHNYLVGSDETVGIDLMASTEAYRELMESQVAALGRGPSVVDLGCGVGSAIPYLARTGRVRATLLDFVPQALQRARARARSEGISAQVICHDLARSGGLPLQTNSHDAALASLVLGYVPNPAQLLKELRRILVPGGIVVASTLRPDADISQIFQDGLAELRDTPDLDARLGSERVDLHRAARNFLNEAAKLLEYEEEGSFEFWDESSFKDLFRRAGYLEITAWRAFGSPPQAVVVRARTPARS